MPDESFKPRYEEYVRRIFEHVREEAAEARKQRASKSEESPFGMVEATLVNLLRRMQLDADLCELPLEKVGMAAFDPMADELDPWKK